MPTHAHTGACHCGAIRVSLAFTRPAAQTQIRSCQCGFCRRHATATATSLICAKYGIYAGAILTVGDKSWSVANTKGQAM